MQEKRHAQMDMSCEARRSNRELFYFTEGPKGCINNQEATDERKSASCKSVAVNSLQARVDSRKSGHRAGFINCSGNDGATKQ